MTGLLRLALAAITAWRSRHAWNHTARQAAREGWGDNWDGTNSVPAADDNVLGTSTKALAACEDIWGRGTARRRNTRT